MPEKRLLYKEALLYSKKKGKVLKRQTNLTRRVKHVLNNIVDYKVPYGRGVKLYCLLPFL